MVRIALILLLAIAGCDCPVGSGTTPDLKTRLGIGLRLRVALTKNELDDLIAWVDQIHTAMCDMGKDPPRNTIVVHGPDAGMTWNGYPVVGMANGCRIKTEWYGRPEGDARKGYSIIAHERLHQLDNSHVLGHSWDDAWLRFVETEAPHRAREVLGW